MEEVNAERIKQKRKVILMDPVQFDYYLMQHKRSSSNRKKENGRA